MIETIKLLGFKFELDFLGEYEKKTDKYKKSRTYKEFLL